MPDLRPEELIVAATMARTLGVDVHQHDDGSKPAMHDLSFRTQVSEAAAVEVTAALDSSSVELWKLVNGTDDRWLIPGLRGGWFLHLDPRTRAKRLFKELPGLLLEAEQSGVTHFPRLVQRKSPPGSIESRVHGIGVVSGDQGGTSHPGSVYMTVEQPRERTGGLVDPSGSAVNPWVTTFLTADAQSDVLAKLHRSAAAQQHAFILVPGFTTAPFGVVDMLWRPLTDPVPNGSPALPAPVTHVWLMSFWSVGSGQRWSPRSGWSRFERVFDVDV